MTRIALTTFAAALYATSALAAQPVPPRVEAEGPVLKVTLSDGRVLKSP
jgi:hypothetical protein